MPYLRPLPPWLLRLCLWIVGTALLWAAAALLLRALNGGPVA